jgi:transaldolase
MTKIFLDSVDIKEITYWNRLGVIAGVTTNPALLSSYKNEDPINLVKKISNIIYPSPVSVQLTAKSKDDLISQAKYFNKINKNIVVKVPAFEKYLDLMKDLKNLKIKTNITLCFDPITALLFAKTGATYVSMIIGRIDDFNLGDESLVERTRKIFDSTSVSTKIIAASFRYPRQFEKAIISGADVATVPPKTLRMSLENHLSLGGLNDFNNKWNELPKRSRDKYEGSK